MGIARRKAGTVVRCPKCAGEVIVPVVQEPQAASAPGRLNQMFEAPDFGKEFASLNAPPEPAPNPLVPAPPYGHAPLLETESQQLPLGVILPDDPPPSPTVNVSRPGVFLTVPMLIGAGSGMLLVIAVTFLLGFFLGRSM
jgi:hypothetical protein